MTNTNIMQVINTHNTNKNIKWSILKNTDTEIVLTNSYDKCVNYSVKVCSDSEDEWVGVKDNHMRSTVCVLTRGYTRWDDYKETEHGIAMALAAAVENFNSTY